MRSLVVGLLSISLTVNAALARAQSEAVVVTASPPSTTSQNKADQSKERAAVLARIQKNPVVEGVGHSSQAMLMMLIVAAVASVSGEAKMAQLRDGSLDTAKVEELVGQATEHLLLGGSTWLGLMSGGAVGAGASKAVTALQSLFESATARPMLRDLLRSGILSLVTFTAFEAGAELWNLSHSMLTDEADYDRAQRAAPALLKALVSPATGNPEHENDRRIMGLILRNMYEILIRDGDLRADFVYNTWRHRIATGHFATMVGAMVGASAAGTALVPGAGTAVGLGFGVAGGLLAIAIPEEHKDSMTDSLADARGRAGRIRTATQVSELILLNDRIGRPALNSLEFELRQQNYLDATTAVFKTLEQRRDDAYTTHFEKVYRAQTRMNVLMGNRKVAKDAGNAEAVAEVNGKLKDAGFNYKQSIRELILYSESETKRLNDMRVPKGQDQAAEIYRIERDRSQRVAAAIRELGRGLQPGQPDQGVVRAAKNALTRYYIAGFKTDKMLRELADSGK